VPDCYCEASNGLLYITNGMQAMLRWDGMSQLMETAGLAAPLTGVVIQAGPDPGDIVGTYNAYVRFVDEYGYFSDLSPISNDLTPVSTTGAITGATNATPVVITSAGHGLTTGNLILIAGVGGNVSANGLWSVTVIDGNDFSLDGSAGTTAYSGGGTWTAGVSQIIYRDCPIPTDPKVVRRQFLRNLSGETQTYYVDIDTYDLTSTSLYSANDDEALGAGTAVPLLNADGSPFANANGVPPPWKTAPQFLLGRMFMGVEVPYSEGSVAVQFGSPFVYGIGTEWTVEMSQSRVIYITGATVSYQIVNVDPVNQIITLIVPYQFASAPYASYTIRPEPGERRLLYYTEAGLPDSWPATDALEVAEDGDDFTGLMVLGSFLYILERHHMYRFTFQTDPATDGYVFQSSASRGCINQRCWVVVDDGAYMLDEQGIHLFSGGTVQPLSEPIQDIFRRGDGEYEINWSASNFFHAVHYPAQETIRWFVCLSGHYLPQHALTLNYRLKRWWIEEYPTPIGSSATLLVNGETLVYLGTTANRVLALWTNLLDGPDASAGTLQGNVASSTLLSLTDTAASFANAGLVGAPVTITDGTGKGQTRLIVSVSGQTLDIDDPWLTLPDTTSVYQVGGINYNWRSGWFRFVESENLSPRRIEVDFEPVDNPATFTLRLTLDYFGNVVVWDQNYSEANLAGVRLQKGSTDMVVDLEYPRGLIQQRLDGHRDNYAAGVYWCFWDLLGTSNSDEIVFYALTLDGVQPN
jgi:hypothetical protein